MPVERVSLMGIFSTEEDAATAIRGLREAAFTVERVYSPIPSHVIADALDLPPSKVGLFTLAGGITGFFTGFFLTWFTATRWSLMVSGKPVVAWIPFFIVAFEFTILFAVFGTVLGFISQARLPRLTIDEQYDPRFSGHKFGVLASCAAQDQNRLRQFFEERGAEIGARNPTPNATAAPQPGGMQP
jgi:hypothetical protein